MRQVAVTQSILNLESVAYFNSNAREEATTREQRALLADALLDWGKVKNPTDKEAAAMFRKLDEVLGEKIRDAAWSRNSEKAEEAAKTAASTFKNALRAVSNPRPTNEASEDAEFIRIDPSVRVSTIIFEAIQIFRRTEIRPTKRQIREAVERRTKPWFTGKNASDTWNDWFLKAGLCGLPD